LEDDMPDPPYREPGEPPSDPGHYERWRQTWLVLRALRATAVPFPADWEERPGGVEFIYRRNTILMRIDAFLALRTREVGPDLDIDVGRVEVTGSLVRLEITSADTTPEVAATINAALGPGTATPEHLLYVCGHACAAIEPEEPADSPVPVPGVPTGQDANPRGGRGMGVRIALLDNGFRSQAARDHWWLRGVTGDEETLANGAELAQDSGHGTFTAGCARVAAPEATVHVVDAASALPTEPPPDPAQPEPPPPDPVSAAWEADLAGEVRDLLAVTVPDILVLNFAALTQSGGPMLGFNAVYDDVVRHLKELLILCPAGNEGEDVPMWPASFSWVASVGGLAANWHDRAPWSNHGRTVDVYAPGDRLVNAYASGTYRTRWVDPEETRQFTGTALWSGTSFSTPLVAGLVAARMSTTGQSSRRAWADLLDLAERQAIPGIGPVLYP
jgi:hypothetical protein